MNSITLDMRNFGLQLLALRKREGMTQSELADRLSLTRQAVSRYERGDCFPDIAVLLQMSRMFGVSLDDWLGACAR